MKSIKIVAVWLMAAGAALFLSSSFGAAGVTKGDFDVSPSGGASYRVPIKVAPGAAGMQPSLALTYSSNSGNGLVGMGWSLSGLTRISRCPTTLAQDGFIDGVDYDGNDRLCLDGQRLVAVVGTYGNSGTEYRTEVESFAKIVQYGSLNGGGTTFKLWYKSGEVLEFGKNGSANVVPGRSYASSWSVSRISDRSGNYMDVHYERGNAHQHYPTRIDYSGNTGTGQQPYNSVRFRYESRPDARSSYVSGGDEKVIRSLRLAKIQTYAGSNRVRDYRLSYGLNSVHQVSALQSITECAGSG